MIEALISAHDIEKCEKEISNFINIDDEARNIISDLCIFGIFRCHVDGLFDSSGSHGGTSMHRIRM